MQYQYDIDCRTYCNAVCTLVAFLAKWNIVTLTGATFCFCRSGAALLMPRGLGRSSANTIETGSSHDVNYNTQVLCCTTVHTIRGNLDRSAEYHKASDAVHTLLCRTGLVCGRRFPGRSKGHSLCGDIGERWRQWLALEGYQDLGRIKRRSPKHELRGPFYSTCAPDGP